MLKGMTTMVNENVNSVPVGADPEIEAMAEAGAHLGHARSRRHPRMAPYLWGVRANIEIIDLTKTKEKLGAALAFLKSSAEERKLFLFVGTRPSAKDIVRDTAQELGYPYVIQRWIGGTLTNFKVIRKRVETLEALEQERASGGFEKYTKKERLKKDEEMRRLVGNFDGLRRLTKLPDVMIVVDISHDDLALREARRVRIPMVALADTNTDPESVTYAIPSNDDARPAIAYMLGRMKASIQEGLAAAEAVRAAAVLTEAAERQESPANHD